MQRNYNFIYSKLVENENDIVGHIAYSLYKAHKIQVIEEFKKKHGTEPQDQDLISFNEFSSNDNYIESYKLKAANILQEFMSEAMEEELEEMHEIMVNNQAEILKEIIAPITPLSWWQQFFTGLIQNIFAGIALAILFAVLIMVLQTQDKGLENVVEDTFDLEIQKKDKKAQAQKDTITIKKIKEGK